MDCGLNYFVAGLPRSRTAWLSAFLSQSGKYCFHEGINGCRSIDEYKAKIGDYGDSSTMFGVIDVNTLFPRAPVVIIEKNAIELSRCIKWCNETFNTDMADQVLQQSNKLMDITGMRVRQSEIDDKLQDIFEFLTDCEWREEYKNMKSLNIQADHRDIDIPALKALNLNNMRAI